MQSIQFENWILTPPPDQSEKILWEVKFNKRHIGYAIKYTRFETRFTLTMILADFSSQERSKIQGLFKSMFGREGAYFRKMK